MAVDAGGASCIDAAVDDRDLEWVCPVPLPQFLQLGLRDWRFGSNAIVSRGDRLARLASAGAATHFALFALWAGAWGSPLRGLGFLLFGVG